MTCQTNSRLNQEVEQGYILQCILTGQSCENRYTPKLTSCFKGARISGANPVMLAAAAALAHKCASKPCTPERPVTSLSVMQGTEPQL
jgi:hypothetical protein